MPGVQSYPVHVQRRNQNSITAHAIAVEGAANNAKEM